MLRWLGVIVVLFLAASGTYALERVVANHCLESGTVFDILSMVEDADTMEPQAVHMTECGAAFALAAEQQYLPDSLERPVFAVAGPEHLRSAGIHPEPRPPETSAARSRS